MGKWNYKKLVLKMASLFGVLLMASPALAATQMSKTKYEQLVLSDNQEIISAKQGTEIAEYKIEMADDSEDQVGSTDIATEKNQGYNQDEADMEYAYALWTEDATTASVLLEAQEAYYKYFILKDKIEWKKDVIDTMEEELDQIQTQIELGTKVSLDAMSQQNDIDQAKSELSGLENDLDVLVMSLNQYMGRDLSEDVSLEEEDIPESVYEVDDIDEVVDTVLENNGDIQKAEDDHSLAAAYVEILEDLNYDDSDADLITAKEESAQLNLDEESERLLVEYNVRNDYNNLLNAQDTVSKQEIAVENARNSRDTIKSRYELGLETELDFEKSKEAVTEAELALHEAQLDQYVQSKTFENFVTQEPRETDEDDE